VSNCSIRSVVHGLFVKAEDAHQPLDGRMGVAIPHTGDQGGALLLLKVAHKQHHRAPMRHLYSENKFQGRPMNTVAAQTFSAPLAGEGEEMVHKFAR